MEVVGCMPARLWRASTVRHQRLLPLNRGQTLLLLLGHRQARAAAAIGQPPWASHLLPADAKALQPNRKPPLPRLKMPPSLLQQQPNLFCIPTTAAAVAQQCRRDRQAAQVWPSSPRPLRHCPSSLLPLPHFKMKTSTASERQRPARKRQRLEIKRCVGQRKSLFICDPPSLRYLKHPLSYIVRAEQKERPPTATRSVPGLAGRLRPSQTQRLCTPPSFCGFRFNQKAECALASQQQKKTEYKAHVSRKKAQKEQALKEQEIQHSIQAAAALAGSRGEEEYDDEDEDDDDGAESDDSEERDRAFKARGQRPHPFLSIQLLTLKFMSHADINGPPFSLCAAAQFAPPKSYEAESIAPPPLAPPADVPPPPPAPQQPIQQAESGDEAYARRLALSQQAQQQSGEDAYARRLAMSQQHQQQPHEPSLRPTPAPAGDVVQQPDAPAPQASSHEDKIAQAQARARAITEKFGKLNAAAASTPAAAAAATQAPAQATSSSDPLSVQPMPPKRPREEDAAEDEGRRP